MKKTKQEEQLHGGKRTVKAALANERARTDRLSKLIEDSTKSHTKLLAEVKELTDKLQQTSDRLATVEAELCSLGSRVTSIEQRLDKPTQVSLPPNT